MLHDEAVKQSSAQDESYRSDNDSIAVEKETDSSRSESIMVSIQRSVNFSISTSEQRSSVEMTEGGESSVEIDGEDSKLQASPEREDLNNELPVNIEYASDSGSVDLMPSGEIERTDEELQSSVEVESDTPHNMSEEREGVEEANADTSYTSRSFDDNDAKISNRESVDEFQALRDMVNEADSYRNYDSAERDEADTSYRGNYDTVAEEDGSDLGNRGSYSTSEERDETDGSYEGSYGMVAEEETKRSYDSLAERDEDNGRYEGGLDTVAEREDEMSYDSLAERDEVEGSYRGSYDDFHSVRDRENSYRRSSGEERNNVEGSYRESVDDYHSVQDKGDGYRKSSNTRYPSETSYRENFDNFDTLRDRDGYRGEMVLLEGAEAEHQRRGSVESENYGTTQSENYRTSRRDSRTGGPRRESMDGDYYRTSRRDSRTGSLDEHYRRGDSQTGSLNREGIDNEPYGRDSRTGSIERDDGIPSRRSESIDSKPDEANREGTVDTYGVPYYQYNSTESPQHRSMKGDNMPRSYRPQDDIRVNFADGARSSRSRERRIRNKRTTKVTSALKK